MLGCYTGTDALDPGGSDPGASAGGGDGAEGPGDDQPVPPTVDEDGCELTARRIWKLTPAQISRTVATMIPGSSDAGLSLAATLPTDDAGFSNDADALAMTEPHVFDLLRFANTMADEVVADPGAVQPCLGQERDAECVASFVERFATQGFRRPPTAEELDDLLVLYEGEQAVRGPDSALYQVVRAVFMSPAFLYRTEIGQATDEPGVFTLTAHERASALSYLLIDGPPDAELLAAAEASELDDPDGLARQVDRLLASPQTSRGIVKLLQEHLHSAKLSQLTKDTEAVPEFDASLAEAFAAENRDFLEYVLWQDDGRWQSVLTAPYTVIDDTLAALYGIPGPGDQPQRVDLPPDQRAGIMTQPGMMAQLSRVNTTDPVHRGRFVREVLLCQPIPAPPPEVDAIPPSDDTKTKREQLAVHREDPTCATCHDLLDPPGLAFENYDLVGRFREQDNGLPIDPSGELDDSGDTSFADAVEMMDVIAREPEAHACLVDAVHRYVSGHAVQSADRCAIEAAEERFAEHDGRVLQLVSDIVTTDRFVLRSGE